MRTPALKKFSFLKKTNYILGIYIAVAMIASLAEALKGVKIFDGQPYTRYNNFLIFKYAFVNLLSGKDLYQLYPDLFFDYFKYSPTFAILMSPFAILPDVPGYFAWNLLNALAVFYSIKTFPAEHREKHTFMLWFVLLELLTNLQNAQSNGIMAALMIFAFKFFEKRNVFWAALCIVLSFYLKVFGIAAAALFLLYPDKFKFVASALFWGILLGILPLLIISPGQLLAQYQSWLHLLQIDQSVSYGISVMGILHSWFAIAPNNMFVLAIALMLLLLPLLRISQFKEQTFRHLFLASLLIWVVIFNHKAESPTFIIAMCGVAIWYFSQPRQTLHLALLIFAFVITSLSPTDIFPRFVRKMWISPFKLKALPCIFIWARITYQLMGEKFDGRSPARNG